LPTLPPRQDQQSDQPCCFVLFPCSGLTTTASRRPQVTVIISFSPKIGRSDKVHCGKPSTRNDGRHGTIRLRRLARARPRERFRVRAGLPVERAERPQTSVTGPSFSGSSFSGSSFSGPSFPRPRNSRARVSRPRISRPRISPRISHSRVANPGIVRSRACTHGAHSNRSFLPRPEGTPS